MTWRADRTLGRWRRRRLLRALHALVHLRRGEPHDLLWACHLAALLVGAGLLLRSADAERRRAALVVLRHCRSGCSISFTGGEFMPTASLLTHVGALVIGIFGVRRLGLPRGAHGRRWRRSRSCGSLTRAVTPAGRTSTSPSRVSTGWERWFPSYPVYFATAARSLASPPSRSRSSCSRRLARRERRRRERMTAP